MSEPNRPRHVPPELRELRLREVRARVAQGLTAIADGDVHDGDAVFDDILDRSARSLIPQQDRLDDVVQDHT